MDNTYVNNQLTQLHYSIYDGIGQWPYFQMTILDYIQRFNKQKHLKSILAKKK